MTNLFKGIILTMFIAVTGFIFAGCDDVPLEGIQIEGLPTETIVVGQTFELRAVFDPINATDQRVQWWTPNNDIIRMDEISETIVSIETLNTGSAVVYLRAYDGNFTDSVTINVSAGTLTLRFQGSVNGVVTRDYNGEPQQMQVVGVTDNVTYLYRLQGETEYTTEAPINAGTYDIRAEINSENYVGSCDGTLQILPQEIQVQANNREISYGSEDIALTYRVIGNFYDNAPIISGSLQREEGTNAGNYRIYEAESFTLTGENSSNYRVTFIEGNYHIQPALATVQVNAPATYYGVTPSNITYTVSGLQNQDTQEDLNISITLPENAHNVGLYELVCEYDNSNYNLTFTNNRINILRTPVTVTIGSAEKKYKTEDPQDYTYTIYNQRNTEDTTKLFYDDVFTVTYSRGEGEDVGQYVVDAEIGGAYVSNYNVTIRTGTLTINPRIVTVEASDATKRYGQNDPNFSYSFTSESDEILDNELTISFTREEGENVGTYDIVPVGNQEKTNYQVNAINGTLSITPALLTLQVVDATKTYLDVDPEYQFVVAEGSDALLEDNNLVVHYEREEGENVGTYQVNMIIDTEDANYQVETLAGELTINKRKLVYNVNDITMRYYQGYSTEGLEYTLDTENGDENVGSIDITTLVNVTVPYQNNVGTYPLDFALNQEMPNYDIVFNGGNLIIEQANVVIKFTDTTLYYGQEPNYTFEYAENSDTMGDAEDGADQFTFTVPSEYYEVLGVGQYTVQGDATQPNANYNITVLSGSLNIVKAEIFATVLDTVITYGQTPTLDYQITNVNGQLFDNEVAYEFVGAGTDADVYEISMNLTKGTENYTLIVTTGELTINQANIIIDVHEKSFKYGDEMVFTYNLNESSDEIINNELTITLSGLEKNVGKYDIVCEVVEANDKHNYNVTVNGAQYEITKRNYVIQLGNAEKYQGEQDPDASAYTKQVASSSDAILEEDMSIITEIMGNMLITRDEGEEPGDYNVYGSAEDGDHYTITILPGKLTILENTTSNK